MNPRIIFRLIAFFATIMLLAALIGWTAHTAWRRMGELQEHLSAQQWKSFQIADHLQQGILGLNNMVLRYAAYDNLEDWTNFETTSATLSRWIAEQQPIESSKAERLLFDQIKVVFTNYLGTADAIHARIYGDRQPIVRVEEFADFEKQSKQILSLGFQLAQVHQEALDSFQRQTTRSLKILRFTMLSSLVLLLAAGCWLSVVVYRELITPLRVQLVESRQLVERQEKLASLGMLAAGIAHEIRNPLTSIKAWLYMQLKHLKSGTPEFEDAQIIGGEINRLERIVKDFLQFARPSEPLLVVVSAEQPLREVRTLMEPELEKSKIKLMLGEAVTAQIRIDPQQIKQVLINLIQNAADSIGKNGTVTLRARLDEKRLNGRQTDVVILEVNDTGKGIQPEAEKRLFDPFFTTKDSGTGLGLPIAARIVEKHHGALQYQTQADHGTTFGIILPLQKP
jgi:signal transduction histidine kinase